MRIINWKDSLTKVKWRSELHAPILCVVSRREHHVKSLTQCFSIDCETIVELYFSLLLGRGASWLALWHVFVSCCCFLYVCLFRMIESQEEDLKLEEVRKLREETADKLLSIVLKSNTLEEVANQFWYSFSLVCYMLYSLLVFPSGWLSSLVNQVEPFNLSYAKFQNCAFCDSGFRTFSFSTYIYVILYSYWLFRRSFSNWPTWRFWTTRWKS